MSPLQARRLVGQPDIVEMARAAQRDDRLSTGALYGALADEVSRLRTMVATVDHDFSMSRIENERLRTALRSVRATTCPQWQAQIISDALRETET